ncbi:protein LURP-one-related 15 [Sesamum alatum]|uniref:Protein LURP-one-related 15 n=1 Tax=Sesamum alatum TaxID=300844 RepID=A0AAE1YHZ8_9LAMI|nr:protein LURP-one-related 15 [Sesamum alatum]
MEFSTTEAENQTSVISSSFCVPSHVHLTIVRKLLAVTDGNFVITDENGIIMFKVIDKLFSFHDRHILLDAAGTPIATFKKKTLSAHKRWQVFRGDSSASTDLLFSAKKSLLVQLKTELDVFLSGNEDENSCVDFKVVGRWLGKSCVIYNKDSTPIAMMQKKRNFGSVVLGKDSFDVIVYPQVDCAFVVALVVILYEINKDKDD